MNSPRDERAAERYAYIVHLLVRVGSASLLRPRIRVDSIRATLEVLAPSIDPQSAEGCAVSETLTRTPQSFAQFLRRRPMWLRKAIASAQTKNAPQVGAS
jgi:hypothetical protein